MKKSIFSIITLILLGIVIISCNKEETEESPRPTIAFLTGTHPGSGLPYITKDTSLVKGTKFAIGISASTQSEENLKRLYIKGTYESVDNRDIIDLAFDSPSIVYDTTVFAYSGTPGTEVFQFTVWDKNDEFSSIDFRITTEPEAPNILEYENKELGAQANVTGSSFATENGSIYTLDEAKINSGEVDFLYFFLAPNNATLAAPDDVTAISIFTGENGLNSWETNNDTRFKTTTLTPSQYDEIQTSAALAAACSVPSPPNLSKQNNLQEDQVIAFKTHNDIFGLIRIEAINGENNAGTIVISVKVQQTE